MADRKRHRTAPPPLTAREIRFCQLWVESGNALRAYIGAGFPHKNAQVAGELSYRLLKKVEIRQYIRRLQAEAADAAGVTAERIAQGLARSAFADRTRVFGPDGEVLPPGEWPEEVRAIIAGVEVEELSEWQDDPDTGKRRKVAVGQKWKVRFERSTEAKKILAQWRRMVGDDKADPGKGGHNPLVVGGEADPNKL
jgi:phage terminase small subunit